MKNTKQRRIGAEVAVGATTIAPVLEERRVEMTVGGFRLGAYRARTAAVRVTTEEDVSHIVVPDPARWVRIGLLATLIVLGTMRRMR